MPTKAELARRELEWRKCADDVTYFIDTYCYMWHKEGGDPINWKLWECQKEALNVFAENRQVIVLKTRQIGLSWTADGFTLHYTMFVANIHCYFRSIGLTEATEQHERIKFMYDHLPEWMQERCELGGKNRKRNDRKSQFSNGSTVNMVASTKRAGHGSAPSLYVWDEAARDEFDIFAVRSIMPAVGEHGKVIIISTANGLGNVFHSKWIEAINGDSNFVPLFFGWRDHPLYTEEFIERERLNYLGDPVGFMEAYPEKWQDAFLASSRCPFSTERISESLDYIVENNIVPETGHLQIDDSGKRIDFIESETGRLEIWKHPVHPRFNKPGKPRVKRPHRYAIGADVALGLSGGDFSAAVVYDIDTDEVVALLRGKWSPEHYAWPLELLARYYNNAWLAVELNMHADTIMESLKAQYPFLYCREKKKRIYDEVTLEPGFLTDVRTKPHIISQLRKYFHSTVRPLRIYSRTILNEMSTYEERDDHTFGASGSNHDDCVIALAIALEAATTAPPIDDGLPLKSVNWRSL